MRLPVIGEIVAGRYEIERVIARGGMGVVFAARQLPIGRLVALKTIIPQDTQDQTVIARFRREVELSMQLRHPNVVEIYDFGDDGGMFYLVMEYLEGADLKDVIRGAGPMDLARSSAIMLQILDALTLAHDNQIVHRDLKPSNVFVTTAGRRKEYVKLLDFGVAKSLEQTTELTMAGNVVGSMHYMAPEGFLGAGVSFQTDVYAMGLIFMEMLLGCRAIQGGNTAQILLLHLNHEIVVPAPFAGTAIEGFVRRACAKPPEERFLEAGEMHDALEAALQGLPGTMRALADDARAAVALVDSGTSPRDLAEGLRRASHEAIPTYSGAVEILADTIAPTLGSSGSFSKPGFTSAKTMVTPLPSILPDEVEPRVPTSVTADVVSLGALTSGPADSKVPYIVAALLVAAVLVVGVMLMFGSGEKGEAPDSGEVARTNEVNAVVAAEAVEAAEVADVKMGADLGVDDGAGDRGPGPDDSEPMMIVRIRSNPSGAEVSRKGERLGATPLALEVQSDELPFEVTLERKGYRPAKTRISRQGVDKGVKVELRLVKTPKKPRKIPSEAKSLDDRLQVGKFK